MVLAIVAVTIGAVSLLASASGPTPIEDRTDRVANAEPRHLRIDTVKSVPRMASSTAWSQRPTTRWAIRRHASYAQDLADTEIGSGSGPAGIAPFGLSEWNDWVVWNTTLRTYLIDPASGRTLRLSGCGDVTATPLNEDALLVEACGSTRRMEWTNGQRRLRTEWTLPVNDIGEIHGRYAIGYKDEHEEVPASIIDTNKGKVVRQLDVDEPEAITLDDEGRLAVAEGIYSDDAEEWDSPRRLRIRVFDRDGDEQWSRKVDVNPNGLSLTLADETVTVSNWGMDGSERFIDVSKERQADTRVSSDGDTLDERAGWARRPIEPVRRTHVDLASGSKNGLGEGLRRRLDHCPHRR